MNISLNLSELTPSTLSEIAANLIENIDNGVNKTHTNRMTIANVYNQLVAIVGDDEADAMFHAVAPRHRRTLHLILLEFA
jgi:hypothetical protein